MSQRGRSSADDALLSLTAQGARPGSTPPRYTNLSKLKGPGPVPAFANPDSQAPANPRRFSDLHGQMQLCLYT
ncbi:hypothetical protein VTI28DRAFT_1397 [Corynascus sepedonium]